MDKVEKEQRHRGAK